MGPRERAFKINMSRVPCGRSGFCLVMRGLPSLLLGEEGNTGFPRRSKGKAHAWRTYGTTEVVPSPVTSENGTVETRERAPASESGRYQGELGLAAEGAEADSHLDGVDARIGLGHSGVGNVHEPDFGAEVVFCTEEVSAKSPARREINLRGTLRDLGVGEESSAFDFE